MIAMNKVQSVARKIAEHVKPRRIILFGSYAAGRPSEDSDIDLLIVKETDLPRHKRAREIHALFNPYPFPMDIVVYTPEEVEYWKDTPAAFVTRAIREGKILYES
jgi:predicted nucleotidyltransferase